ncbi:MAG: hypothetical protein HYR85_24615, partial [Planctomycetes bacterium]|nr:hypothetical protein [Planctomycetota bacterium]
LRLPLPSFGLLCPIGLVGLAIALRRPRGGFLAPAVFEIDAASVILFFVISRYRITAVPMLIVGAALAVVTLVDFVRERRLVSVGAMVIAGSLLALFVNRNLGDEPPNLSEGYRIRALKRLTADDRSGATSDAERAVAEDRKNYEAFRLLAKLRHESGDARGAISAVEGALRCIPPWPVAEPLWIFLARLHASVGEKDEGLRILEAVRDQRKPSGGAPAIDAEIERMKKS